MPINSIDFIDESDESVIDGEHSTLYLSPFTPESNKSLWGYVDAPHAKDIDDREAEKLVTTSEAIEDLPQNDNELAAKFGLKTQENSYGKDGSKYNTDADKVYMDDATRKKLGVEEGRKFAGLIVKMGRKSAQNSNSYCPIIVKGESQKKAVLKEIKEKNKLKYVLRLNEPMRSALKIKEGGKINLNGKEFTVKNAIKDPATGKQLPIVCPENFKDALKKLLVQKKLSDEYTGNITQMAHLKGASAIITKTNRRIVDINRLPENASNPRTIREHQQGVLEYRALKRKALKHAGLLGEDNKATSPFLHIALHGKKDKSHAEGQEEADIEIGTRDGKTCDDNTKKWFMDRLTALLKEKRIKMKSGENKYREVTITDKSRFQGDQSKENGPIKHGKENFKTIQVEICHSLRKKYPAEIADIIYKLLEDFTKKHNPDYSSEAQNIAEETSSQADQVINEDKDAPTKTAEKKPAIEIHPTIAPVPHISMADLNMAVIHESLIKDKMPNLKSGDSIEITVGENDPGKKVTLKVRVAKSSEFDFIGIPAEDLLCLDEATREKLGIQKWNKTALKIRKV